MFLITAKKLKKSFMLFAIIPQPPALEIKPTYWLFNNA